jgi:outer membrane protein assembly factor BamB
LRLTVYFKKPLFLLLYKLNLFEYTMRLRLSFLIIIVCLKSFAQESIINSNGLHTLNHLNGAVFSSLAKTLNNNVMVGSHNKHVYFFNENGKLINNFKAGGWFHSTPKLFKNNTIGLGCYDGFFYFFDQMGNMITKIRPGGFIFTEPVEIGDLLIFGSNRGKVIFYDRADGKFTYEKVKKLVHGSPTVLSDGQIVIGSNSGILYFLDQNHKVSASFKSHGWIMHSKPLETYNGLVVFGSYDNYLYALDKKGNLEWKFKTKGNIHCSPLQTPDSTIVFGSFDGNVYFLDQHGQLINQTKTDKKIVSSPVMVNDSVVVIGSFDNQLYFFGSKGNKLGSYDTKGKIFSTPITLSDGTIICCTMNGNLSYIVPEEIAKIISGKKEEQKQVER